MTKAPGEILELFRGGYLSMAETIDALDGHVGYVSVELLNIERAISDDLREQNAKLREAAATPAVGGEAVNDTVRKIVYQMTPADQYDLAFKVAENVGYILVREPDHPDSPHLAAPPASPLRGRDELHPDTQDLVEKLSWALEDKLLRSQKKYGYTNGWLTDDWKDECQLQLMEHLEKGDPLDVVAYAAFMWARGWPTASPPEQPAAAGKLACRRCGGWGTIRLGNGDRETCELCHGTTIDPDQQPAAAPFQPHENCNCLMCLAEKPRDET